MSNEKNMVLVTGSTGNVGRTEPAMITDTVAEITGAPAHTFRQWAIDHAADFQEGRAQ